jgi:hypothetical protein
MQRTGSRHGKLVTSHNPGARVETIEKGAGMFTSAPGRALGLILAVVALVQLLGPSSVAAQEDAEDVLVRVNGTVDLPTGEGVDVLVAVNSPTSISGSVRDTLVVVNETATISGDIGSEVFVYNGEIHLEPTARVAGDLTLVNSQLVQADGAEVAGDVVERQGAEVAGELSRVAEAVSFIAWIGMTILFVVVSLVWAAVGGRQLSGLAGLLAARPDLAVGGALVFWIAAPIIAVVVMFTVIGLPLGLAILLVLLPIMWVLGYVVAGTRLGLFVDELRGARTDLEHPYLTSVVGVLVLQLIGLVPWVGGFVVMVAGLFGAGAIVVHAWRRARASFGSNRQPLFDPQP